MNHHLAPLAGVQKFRDYVITPQKHLLANEGALLVDDHPTMINAFRAFGGQAMLFPQAWNTKEFRDEIQHDALRRIIEGR
jgi:hypothetical protein